MQKAIISNHQYNHTDPVIEKKVEALLARMTLPEKVGQLVQQSPFAHLDWKEIERKKAQAAVKGQPFSFLEALPMETKEMITAGKTGTVMCTDVTLINALQRLAVEGSRLHIPLLIAADVVHGLCSVFPIPLAQACSWNMDLIERVETAAAAEASACGVNWIFAPMVDIARDPRWGRIAEGAGEDPCLGARIAAARVRGFQSSSLPTSRRVAACPKHYIGYGAAEAGRDYNTADFSERSLRDIYLPPFQSAVETGAGSLMSSFNELSGVPVTANSFLLTTILRGEWGWPGVVISDFNAIGELIRHGVAADLKDAARQAILAGVDIDMESGAYSGHLAELVEEGLVPLEKVDEAVRRVLRLKFALELFDNPYTDETLRERILLNPDYRDLALDAARQSMVLVKNEQNLLPLEPGKNRIALIGPLADDAANLLGTWAGDGQAGDVDTLLKGLTAYVSPEKLALVKGCSIEGNENDDFSAAIEAARKSDVVILALGEGCGMSGEAHSRARLGLPGRQQELAEEVMAIGKPTIVVLHCGRPLVVPSLVEKAHAVLVAWHGGIRAGQAAADILFGQVNPSGRLTASWPVAEGQIPVYYACKPTGRPATGEGTTQFEDAYCSSYMDIPNDPLFSFGYGLNYTRFEYSDLVVETPSLTAGEILKVSVRLTNAGSREGVEVVQFYVRDQVASVTQPVKELKGFQRIELKSGESKQVHFVVPVRELGFTGLDGEYVVEPGKFTLWIGPDSTGGLQGEFKVHP